jgi:hypothetical protein
MAFGAWAQTGHLFVDNTEGLRLLVMVEDLEVQVRRSLSHGYIAAIITPQSFSGRNQDRIKFEDRKQRRWARISRRSKIKYDKSMRKL